MCHVFQKDASVSHGVGLDEVLVHIDLPGEALNVGVSIHRDETFAAFVAGVSERLHDAKNPEHAAMCLHEFLSDRLDRTHLTGGQAQCGGFNRELSTRHSIVNTFVRSRRNDAGRIARQQHVAPVAPA